MQHTVNAVAHAQILLSGFKVNVRSAVLDCLGNQQVHELDDGCVFDDFLQPSEVITCGFISIFKSGGEVVKVRVSAVVAVNRGHNIGAGCHSWQHFVTTDRANIVRGKHVGRVSHRNHDAAVFKANGNGHVLTAH